MKNWDSNYYLCNISFQSNTYLNSTYSRGMFIKRTLTEEEYLLKEHTVFCLTPKAVLYLLSFGRMQYTICLEGCLDVIECIIKIKSGSHKSLRLENLVRQQI